MTSSKDSQHMTSYQLLFVKFQTKRIHNGEFVKFTLLDRSIIIIISFLRKHCPVNVAVIKSNPMKRFSGSACNFSQAVYTFKTLKLIIREM